MEEGEEITNGTGAVGVYGVAQPRPLLGAKNDSASKKTPSLVVACPRASLSGRMNPQHCYKRFVTASCMLIAEIMIIIFMDMATFL